MKALTTLRRLADLPVGEKMIAYVGNFEYDIARCDKLSPNDKGAPKYKQVLTTLQDVLRMMHDSGRIRLSRVEHKHHRTSNKGKEHEWRDFTYEVTKLR